ncbi:MAG: SH3 domain-containing protein [Lachnospiraceae bacterium]|nr:SH3 domain-containing protein [Lachnospiraceae bacterium]
MRKKAIPIFVVLGLIFLIVSISGISILIKNFTPGKERMELSEYYHLTEDSQIPITLNHSVLDTYATKIDGHIYLDYHFIHDNLNSRFYWDTNENILLYTTADSIISANVESTNYSIGKTSTNHDKVIVKATADSAWVDIEFVKQYSDFTYTLYEEPTRIVITNDWKEITTATLKKNTVVRQKGGIKSPILCDVAKGDSIVILETDEKFTKVCTTDGITGYISSKYVKNTKTEALTSDFVSEEFTHIKLNKAINLAWHQMGGSSSRTQAVSVLSDSKGINVLSPTWFKVKDNTGNISSIADSSYVDYCHSQNVDVWGLVSNFEIEGVNTSEVLTHTSSRQNLVNQLIAVALQYNLDGINVDFEAMNGSEIGDSYIQFIRELSIKCANNDIVLSVDVPVPAPYNDFYNYTELGLFADYVILMAYDEHYGQQSGEGSVASLSWTKEAVDNLLAENVPADQIIFGIPFYTKLWKLTPTTEEATENNYMIAFENLGMNTAKEWMTNNIDEWTWLEDCGQYYGQTVQNGITYKMWLEDTSSLEQRLQLMKEYSLAGAGFWKLGLESKNAWDTIIKFIN